MVNFPIRIPDCDPHNPAILNSFLAFDPSICSTVAFFPFGNPDHVIFSVSIGFLSNSKGYALFISQLMTILELIGVVFMII